MSSSTVAIALSASSIHGDVGPPHAPSAHRRTIAKHVSQRPGTAPRLAQEGLEVLPGTFVAAPLQSLIGSHKRSRSSARCSGSAATQARKMLCRSI
jgi:hypothetical protein